MKIYEKELNDGLSDALKNNSLAFECVISTKERSEEETFQILKAIADCLPQRKQSDLHYFNSVLVSTGWNKNDDVFTKAELWSSRHTPVNKPVNYMHDETDIIGHMTGSMVIDQNGNLISDETEESAIPDMFDIVTSAVIYKSWGDKETRERIDELCQEINHGDWSVSMECIFNDFDYAISSENGVNKVLARNEESAFLTKHLRSYGGTGEFQGYKIGRVLKNLTFSGKGIVNKPANPRSVIFSKDVDPFNSQANIDISSFKVLTAMEVEMTQPSPEQVGQMQKDLDAAKAEIESVKANMLKSSEAADKTVADLNAAIAEKDQKLAAYEAQVKELNDAIAAMKKKEKECDDEIAGLKKNMKTMCRKQKMAKCNISEAELEDYLTKFDAASDEMFDSVVSLLEKNKQVAAVEPSKEESADVESLETVETTEASVVETVSDDSGNKAMASAIEWLSKSVLKSTKNLK